jgi:hypothetical protein
MLGKTPSPKEVFDAHIACQIVATDCRLQAAVFQTSLRTRPYLVARSDPGTREAHGDFLLAHHRTEQEALRAMARVGEWEMISDSVAPLVKAARTRSRR